MKLVYRAVDQSPAYVEAYVAGKEDRDYIDIELPTRSISMTVTETIDLIDDLVEALRAIQKSYS